MLSHFLSSSFFVLLISSQLKNNRTKGVLVWQTYYGSILVGPTAEDQTERENAEVTEEVLQQLKRTGERIIPALASVSPTKEECYAGLRPATNFKDYYIEAMQDRHWITVASIRSTGICSRPPSPLLFPSSIFFSPFSLRFPFTLLSLLLLLLTHIYARVQEYLPRWASQNMLLIFLRRTFDLFGLISLYPDRRQ